MTASAALSLRAAVFARLSSDAALSGLLGGAKIHDEPPRAALPPYVALGPMTARDVSGDLVPAVEHELALELWSREGGLAEALKAADRVVRLLDGAELALDGHRLASLAWRFTAADRATNADFRRAEIAFRAVTEPLD
ncbi:DUF3168 domain-containing protein [Methylopila henanensis]|uniref:DUF3168 domain-containing protein n=1 Tax=Methylopila henanensis TaxID=873516 RepID=A0ABW4K560_9HYPH